MPSVPQALVSFVTMQFQLCTVFFTFSLGTKTHYFGRTILHGGARVHPSEYLTTNSHSSTLGFFFFSSSSVFSFDYCCELLNSIKQLVEDSLFDTSNSLKITGFTPEVILSKGLALSLSVSVSLSLSFSLSLSGTDSPILV